jgi:hypothetical protein
MIKVQVNMIRMRLIAPASGKAFSLSECAY